MPSAPLGAHYPTTAPYRQPSYCAIRSWWVQRKRTRGKAIGQRERNRRVIIKRLARDDLLRKTENTQIKTEFVWMFVSLALDFLNFFQMRGSCSTQSTGTGWPRLYRQECTFEVRTIGNRDTNLFSSYCCTHQLLLPPRYPTKIFRILKKTPRHRKIHLCRLQADDTARKFKLLYLKRCGGNCHLH